MYRLWKIFPLGCLLISLVASMQLFATEKESDETAKQTLRQLLNQFENLQASFSQRVVDLQGQELQSTQGTVALQKPEKLRWEVVIPEPTLLIADGHTIFNVDSFVEQVTLLDQQEFTRSNPLMLLISDDESQWQNITVHYQKNAFYVYPKSADSSISKLVIYFDEAGVLSKLVSEDQQQQSNQVDFSDVNYNSMLDKTIFSYQAPEHWVIDDQRAAAQANQ